MMFHAMGISRRNGIQSAASPGLAAAYPTQAKPSSAQHSMHLQGFAGVFRAGRHKTTGVTEKPDHPGRDDSLVGAEDKANCAITQRVHGSFSGASRCLSDLRFFHSAPYSSVCCRGCFRIEADRVHAAMQVNPAGSPQQEMPCELLRRDAMPPRPGPGAWGS